MDDPTKGEWGAVVSPRQKWTKDRATTYLLERGFKDVLKELKVVIVPIQHLANFVPNVNISQYDKDSSAIVLPHYSPTGEPYNYDTARIIQPEVVAASFADQTKSPPKLLCPGNTIPKPHFSTLNGDLKDYVYVTESRLKADIIAKCGFYAVGINGVWGWSHKNSNSRVLPELWEFPWNRTKGIIFVPDSNTDNPNVMAGTVQFAANMRMRGVEVKVVHIPKAGDRDQGIDDYYVANGQAATVELLQAFQDIERDELTTKKWALNEKVVFVRSLSRYAEIDTGHLMSYSEFTKGNYGNWLVQTEDKPVAVPVVWNSWQMRREVAQLAYRPGGPSLEEKEYLNLWKGMGIEPTPGDVTPFTEFLRNNLPKEAEYEWVLKWLAYPLQNLGAKLMTSLVCIGPQGCGKSLLGNLMCQIYGYANSAMITREQLDSSFNSIYSAKQFVVIDEMSKNAKKDTALASSNKLKTLITEPRLIVNRKGQPEYEIENHMNIMMTSNHMDAVYLEDGDRRFYVSEFTPVVDRSSSPEYWDRFVRWALDNLGSIYHYLLSYPLQGFDSNARAPETEAKKEMVRASYGEEQQLASMLVESPEEILGVLGFPTTLEYVVPGRILDAWWIHQGRGSKASQSNYVRFGKALQELGIPKPTQMKASGQRMIKLRPGEWDSSKANQDLRNFTKKS